MQRRRARTNAREKPVHARSSFSIQEKAIFSNAFLRFLPIPPLGEHAWIAQ